MKAVGKEGDEVAEHMARAGETVEQQQLGCLGIPGFAVKHVEPFNADRAVSNRSHLGFSLLCGNLAGGAKTVECRFLR